MGCCGQKDNKVSPENDSTKPPQPTLEDIYERELASKRHNCTDIICLVLFIVLCLIQICFAIVIFVKGGDPKRILLPHDSAGNACEGSTPYLFYFNLVECATITAAITSCPSPTVCVAECPNQNLLYAVESHRETLLTFCNQVKLASRYGGTVPATVNILDYTTLAQDDICPSYVLDSKSYYSRCLPAIISEVIEGVSNVLTTTNSSGDSIPIVDVSKNSITDTMIEKGAQFVRDLLSLKSIYQSCIEDFSNASYMIGVLLGIGIVATFFYIVIMRWILAPMIYGSFIAIVLLLSFCVYYCIDKYMTLKDNGQSFSVTAGTSSYFSNSSTWLVLGIISGVVLIIIVILFIALIKRVRIAIKIIIEASKAVTSIFISLFFPFFPLILELAVLIYFIAVSVYLSTAGTAVYKLANNTNMSSPLGESCNPDDPTVQCYFYNYGWDSASSMDSAMKFLSQYQWLPHIYNLFMFFWVQSFLIGFNQMVLAGSFGIWYWSKSKSSCILFTAFKDTIIYHLGSVAFGSLLIAIVKLIRWLITYLEKKLQKAAGNNPVTKCIISFTACCCKCFFWCLEKFLKFISKNAYIMVAIYGRNFCMSAIDAMKLLLSNPLRAAVLDSVSDFILFIGKLLISTLVGVIGFFFFTKTIYVSPEYAKYFAPDLHYYWVPLACCVFGTYFIASTFFSVFEMAIDTVFLCAMKDLDIHDGSVEKPYFMSTQLLKIMDVKNKPEVDENEQKSKKKNKNKNKNSDDVEEMPKDNDKSKDD